MTDQADARVHAALANTYNRADCVTAQIRNDLTPAGPTATPAQVRMRAITPAN
jgi:hypothetical protein